MKVVGSSRDYQRARPVVQAVDVGCLRNEHGIAGEPCVMGVRPVVSPKGT